MVGARRRPERTLAAVIAVLVFALYARTAGFGYVFDDGNYLLANPGLAQGLGWAGVRWSFTAFHHSNWHPVAWLSHLADRALFGPGPGPAHLVNAAVHGACSAAFFLVLRRMTGALLPSACAAMLFAVHPLRVESVAWVTERKDPLSTIFWLLATGAWVRYARRPAPARYAVVVAWFALALMTKPMAVTFPFALLLLDFWPLGRLRTAAGAGRLLREKVPLLLLAAASSAVTFAAQQGAGMVRTWERYTLGVRLENAVVSYVKYLALTFWPRGLAVYYPHPIEALPAATVAGAAFLLAATLAVALRRALRRPWLAVGWLWYLGTLAPVIGIVQVGAQALADRYSYLPSLGLLTALVWEAGRRARGLRRGPALLAAAGIAAVAAFSLITFRQLEFWRDERALFERALAVTERNALAHYNLAALDAAEGHVAPALAHYHSAALIAPEFAGLRVNYGLLLAGAGRTREAEVQYREALRLDPANAEAHLNLGVLLAARGQLGAAIEQYRAALGVRPDMVAARMNLGNALDDAGLPAEAIREYREALRLDPGDAQLHYNLGLALENSGRREEARAEYREALWLDPSHWQARARLGAVRP